MFSAGRATITPVVEWARRVLKVKAGCSARELKEAYKVQAIASHPDRHPPELKAAATKKFQRCSEAYSILQQNNDQSNVPNEKREPIRRHGRGVDAEQIFRQTFSGLSDNEVLSAILGHKVGETTGMGVLSLRRIRRQLIQSDPQSTSQPSRVGKTDDRFPWRPTPPPPGPHEGSPSSSRYDFSFDVGGFDVGDVGAAHVADDEDICIYW